MKKNKYLVTSNNLNKMSNEENKDPGGENPPKEEEQNPSEPPQNQTEQQEPQEQPQNEDQNQNQPNEQPQQEGEAESNPQPQPQQEEHENIEASNPEQHKEEEKKQKPEEGKKINHFSRRAHQEMSSDNPDGEGGESPGNENEEEEYEEGEDGEDGGNSSERKENDYNSKELEDFLAICDHVVKPLEQKDIISRSLNNFQNNIKNSLDQIDKNFTLQRIDLPNQPNKDIAKDSQSVRALEEVVKKYTESITIAQEQLTNYPKNITSAMMEIDNRKRAVSNWSILAQQLKSENTQRIVDILKLSEESQKGNTFETKISEFEKTFEDANDYLKFLQTLERSIKDLSSDDLAVIEHSIPGIFHNLKIIWMISKHKDPNKFGFLLEVMAKEIWTKISEKVQLKALFKTNPDEIDQSIQLITQANKVATQWNSHYSDTKNKTKWEYAHNKITKDLEYVKTICGKLKNGLNKIKGFLKFLGHDLERVIG